MERDSGDLVDRWSIAKLKAERIGSDESKDEAQSFGIEVTSLVTATPELEAFCELLYSINDYIWQLEAGLKGGKEELVDKNYILSKKNDEANAKIGATTILIRNFNDLRVQVKNIINKKMGEGFQDKKSNHLSER